MEWRIVERVERCRFGHRWCEWRPVWGILISPFSWVGLSGKMVAWCRSHQCGLRLPMSVSLMEMFVGNFDMVAKG